MHVFQILLEGLEVVERLFAHNEFQQALFYIGINVCLIGASGLSLFSVVVDEVRQSLGSSLLFPEGQRIRLAAFVVFLGQDVVEVSIFEGVPLLRSRAKELAHRWKRHLP